MTPAPFAVLRTLPIEASPLKDASTIARSLTLGGGGYLAESAMGEGVVEANLQQAIE